MIKMALFGCGRIGRLHAQNIAQNQGAELMQVYDVQQLSTDQLATLHNCEAALSVAAILANSDIDAVLIGTSTDTHADLIEKSAKAGKAIFCEKPIDLSLDRVKQCEATITPYNVPFQIGFNRWFDSSHKSAKNAVVTGQICDLQQVIITLRDPEMPPQSYMETSGGMFRDMTIHDFDLARFLLGEEPTEIFATATALVNPEACAAVGDIDSAMIQIKTASGKLCQINNSRQAVYGYDQWVELFGSNGMLIYDNQRPHDLKSFNATQTGKPKPYQSFSLERYAEAFVTELNAFIDCVSNNKPTEVGFEDGAKALALAEAAYQPLETRKSVHL